MALHDQHKKPMPASLNRKNIRLPALNYVGMREYFVTICCHGREPLFARRENALPILEQLQSSAGQHSFAVHAYCCMPDHLHILAAGSSESSDLLSFVNSFKEHTGYEFTQRTGRPLWQFKFYDHILRGGDGIERVAWYIWMNPVRKGLCAHPAEFPYSGSFTRLSRDQAPPDRPWNAPWTGDKAQNAWRSPRARLVLSAPFSRHVSSRHAAHREVLRAKKFRRGGVVKTPPRRIGTTHCALFYSLRVVRRACCYSVEIAT